MQSTLFVYYFFFPLKKGKRKRSKSKRFLSSFLAGQYKLAKLNLTGRFCKTHLKFITLLSRACCFPDETFMKSRCFVIGDTQVHTGHSQIKSFSNERSFNTFVRSRRCVETLFVRKTSKRCLEQETSCTGHSHARSMSSRSLCLLLIHFVKEA